MFGLRTVIRIILNNPIPLRFWKVFLRQKMYFHIHELCKIRLSLEIISFPSFIPPDIFFISALLKYDRLILLRKNVVFSFLNTAIAFLHTWNGNASCRRFSSGDNFISITARLCSAETEVFSSSLSFRISQTLCHYGFLKILRF